MPMQTSLRGAPAAGPAASGGRASSYQIRASVLDAALAIGLNDASVNSWLYRPEDHDELLEDIERDLEEQPPTPGLTSPGGTSEESSASQAHPGISPSGGHFASFPVQPIPSSSSITSDIFPKPLEQAKPPRPKPGKNKLRKPRRSNGAETGDESDGGYVSDATSKRKADKPPPLPLAPPTPIDGEDSDGGYLSSVSTKSKRSKTKSKKKDKHSAEPGDESDGGYLSESSKKKSKIGSLFRRKTKDPTLSPTMGTTPPVPPVPALPRPPMPLPIAEMYARPSESSSVIEDRLMTATPTSGMSISRPSIESGNLTPTYSHRAPGMSRTATDDSMESFESESPSRGITPTPSFLHPDEIVRGPTPLALRPEDFTPRPKPSTPRAAAPRANGNVRPDVALLAAAGLPPPSPQPAVSPLPPSTDNPPNSGRTRAPSDTAQDFAFKTWRFPQQSASPSTPIGSRAPPFVVTRSRSDESLIGQARPNLTLDPPSRSPSPAPTSAYLVPSSQPPSRSASPVSDQRGMMYLSPVRSASPSPTGDYLVASPPSPGLPRSPGVGLSPNVPRPNQLRVNTRTLSPSAPSSPGGIRIRPSPSTSPISSSAQYANLPGGPPSRVGLTQYDLPPPSPPPSGPLPRPPPGARVERHSPESHAPPPPRAYVEPSSSSGLRVSPSLSSLRPSSPSSLGVSTSGTVRRGRESPFPAKPLVDANGIKRTASIGYRPSPGVSPAVSRNASRQPSPELVNNVYGRDSFGSEGADSVEDEEIQSVIARFAPNEHGQLNVSDRQQAMVGLGARSNIGTSNSLPRNIGQRSANLAPPGRPSASARTSSDDGAYPRVSYLEDDDASRYSIADTYADGRSTMYRMSTWSATTDTRGMGQSAALSEETSGEARERFMMKVRGMIDREERDRAPSPAPAMRAGQGNGLANTNQGWRGGRSPAVMRGTGMGNGERI